MNEIEDDRARRYAEAYQANYGFEAVMVRARQRLLLDVLADQKPRIVVEVGCGDQPLYARAVIERRELIHWITVEPSSTFADLARSAALPAPRCDVVQARFEDATEQVLQLCDGHADLVICSGLLHEVPEPRAILQAAHLVLDQDGILHVNAPNAYSLHRRLAQRAALIPDVHALTDRNAVLEQRRVLDLQQLEGTVSDAGFHIVDRGGYFLKPFTHDQMSSLNFLTPYLLEGLWSLGAEFPELASEIYVNARRHH